MELSCFSFDVTYYSGKKNAVVDMRSRVCVSTTFRDDIYNKYLCHLGMMKILHMVQIRKLPFLVEGVKGVMMTCQICAELKPRTGIVIKAIQPFERLALDFKGPLSLKTRNKYLLTIIDSCFLFAISCSDMKATTPCYLFCHLRINCLHTF